MHKPSPIFILLTGISIFTAQSPSAQASPSPTLQVEAQPRKQCQPVERELKASETHAYKITLEAGQFLNAAVNQRGVDVVVRVFAPDGSNIAEIDSPNGTAGDQPIALEAKTTGAYRIEISPVEPAAQPGRYEIRVGEILSADAYARRPAENKRKQQAVIGWLKSNAIPLKAVEAGNGFQDLQPLQRVFPVQTPDAGVSRERNGLPRLRDGGELFGLSKHQRLRDGQNGRWRDGSRQPGLCYMEHGRSAGDVGLDARIQRRCSA